VREGDAFLPLKQDNLTDLLLNSQISGRLNQLRRRYKQEFNQNEWRANSLGDRLVPCFIVPRLADRVFLRWLVRVSDPV